MILVVHIEICPRKANIFRQYSINYKFIFSNIEKNEQYPTVYQNYSDIQCCVRWDDTHAQNQVLHFDVTTEICAYMDKCGR